MEVFEGKDKAFERRFVGGSLATLLYMVEHHVISMDPWLSHVQSSDQPDLAVIDLDPMPGVPYKTVRTIACRLHDLLDEARVPHLVKTSGLSGLHVYIPLAEGTDYENARIVCEVFATRIARDDPEQATVARAIRDRGRRVYLDCLQNMRAKTVAAPYSARPGQRATVSAPVTWKELQEGAELEDFTMMTMMSRLEAGIDPWRSWRTMRRVDVQALARQPGTRDGKGGR